MELLLFTLLVSLLDSLNPSTIITQMLILVKSKSVKLSSYFTIATFCTYLLVGYLFSFGVSALLTNFISRLNIIWNEVFISIETGLLLLCIYFLVSKLRKQKKGEKAKSIFLKPVPIITLAVGSTISDFPTAFPYLAFIGKAKGLGNVVALGYFVLYNILYILPLIILLMLYRKNGQYVESHFRKIESVIDKIGSILLYTILITLIVLFLTDIILFCIDLDSLWGFLGLY